MITRKMLFSLRVLTCFIWGGMTALVVQTSLQSNLWIDGATLMKYPWFVTTLWDFYFNIALISLWVCYKERCPGYRWVWIISFICLGSIATGWYVFWQLLKVKEGDSWSKLWLRSQDVCDEKRVT